MKHLTAVFKAVLLIAVLAPLAACSGGTFIDPGHLGAVDMVDLSSYDGNSGNDYDYDDDDSGGKPSELPSGATYNQAMSKLDEIINYCNSHSGNGLVKTGAELLQNSLSSSTWSSVASTRIDAINALISGLN
jgi:hypothetical protein